MKKISHHRLILFLLFLLFTLTAGCSPNDTDKGNDVETTAKAVKPSEKKSSEAAIPKADDTFEGMMTQEQGILMEEIFNKKLDGKTGWDAQPYLNYYNDTFKKSSEKTITQYVKEHKELTDEELYDYLIYAIGTGEYQTYYDQLRMYDPGFKAPELPTGSAEEKEEQQTPKKTNVVVLLDASGSMNAEVPGGKKIDIAKDAISTFVSSLPKNTNTSLLVYGHEGTGSDADKAKSCGKIDAVYPLKPYAQTEFQTAMNKFKASGWTPLSQAISKAQELLTNYGAEYNNKIYIVSDGIETCDGNPVKAAQSLHGSNIQATVNIIGFDVDDEGVQQLKQVAEAGKGEFIRVSDKSELDAQIKNKWSPSIFEISGKQAVHAFDMLDARKEIVNLANSLNSLSINEKSRIEGAIQTLHIEKLISDSVQEELLAKASDMHKIREDGIEQLRNKKEEELKNIQENYQQQIDEWKKQWE